MVSRKVVVKNENGFHVRPAGRLAKAAEQCSSRVEILYQNNVINAKSLLNIVSVTIVKGNEIELRCTGPKELEDMERMLDVMNHLE